QVDVHPRRRVGGGRRRLAAQGRVEAELVAAGRFRIGGLAAEGFEVVGDRFDRRTHRPRAGGRVREVRDRFVVGGDRFPVLLPRITLLVWEFVFEDFVDRAAEFLIAAERVFVARGEAWRPAQIVVSWFGGDAPGDDRDLRRGPDHRDPDRAEVE